jgi:hypothetical protein
MTLMLKPQSPRARAPIRRRRIGRPKANVRRKDTDAPILPADVASTRQDFPPRDAFFDRRSHRAT